MSLFNILIIIGVALVIWNKIMTKEQKDKVKDTASKFTKGNS